jgi:hypothetical protein
MKRSSFHSEKKRFKLVFLLYDIFPVFKKWRLDPFLFKNQCLMAIFMILHLSIKTMQEPYLIHIIYQTVIDLDIRI